MKKRTKAAYVAINGQVRVHVYKYATGRFCVVWRKFAGDKPRRETFSVKSQATARADEMAETIANGQADVLELTLVDRESYIAAIRALQPLGIPLHTAILEYVLAKQALPHIHDSLVAAAANQKRSVAFGPCPSAPEMLRRLIAQAEEDRRSDIYLRGLRYDLTKFVTEFPSLSALTAEKVRDYLRALRNRQGERVSDRRRDNIRDAIVTLVRFAGRPPERFLSTDIVEAIGAIPQIARRGHVTTFTPAELRALLTHIDTLDPRWLPWAAIAAFSGLRTSELFRLEWGAFKWARNAIAISDRVADKLDEARHSPLLPVLAEWLAPWRHLTSGFVVPREAGCTWRALEGQQERARTLWLKALRWPKWRHNGLRHSFGSHRLGVLEDIAKVAHEMGNSPNEVRQSYNDSKDPVEAAEYFALLPSHRRAIEPGKIISLPT